MRGFELRCVCTGGLCSLDCSLWVGVTGGVTLNTHGPIESDFPQAMACFTYLESSPEKEVFTTRTVTPGESLHLKRLCFSC